MIKKLHIGLFLFLFCNVVVNAQTMIGTNGLTQAVIDAASSGDVLLLTGDQTLTATLAIDKNLTIRGNETNSDGTPVIVIKQTSTGRHFTSSTAGITINFESVAIIGPNADYNAGIVTSNGGTNFGGGITTGTSTTQLNILSCVMAGCNSSNTGGGIYAAGQLTVSDSQVSYNTATGAVSSSGGGIYSIGTLVLNNTTINNNAATVTNTTASDPNTYGGGVYATNALTLNQVTITDNAASTTNAGIATLSRSFGGGIYAGNGLTLKGAIVFRRNTAKADGTGNKGGEGGGIYYKTGGILSADLKQLLVDNCASTVRGGGIYLNDDGVLKHLIVTNNTTGDDGGGIHAYKALTLSGNNTISDNKAGWTGTTYAGGGDGGGIYANGSLSLSDTLRCSNNGAGADGGGIYIEGLASISATGLKLLQLDGNNAGVNNDNGAGGGIFVHAGTTVDFSTVDSLIVTNNTASNYGGGIATHSMLTLRNATINYNTAGWNGGGGIYSANTLTVNNAIINDNNAVGWHGGGIYSVSVCTLNNVTINDNTTTTSGGGIYSSNLLTLNGKNIVSGNKAGWTGTAHTTSSYYGGGIFISSNFVISDTLICNNNATSAYGGGIYKSSSSATLNASDLKFLQLNNNAAGKTATGGGGGAYLGGSASVGADFSNAKFFEVTGNTASYVGGGIYSVGPFTLRSATINNNEAASHGGGVYASNLLTLSGNNTFMRNKAGWTGTAYTTTAVYGGGIYANGNFILSDTLICNYNGAASVGGGLYKGSASTIDATGLKFLQLNNNAAGQGTIQGGGGAYLNGATITTDFSKVVSAEIIGNTVTGGGGGIFSVGPLLLSNALVNSNTSGTNGGGVYASNALTLKNVTASYNKAGYLNGTWQTSGGGAGIYANDMLTLQGILVLENDTAATGGGGIFKSNLPNTSSFVVTGLTALTVNKNTALTSAGGGIYTASILILNKKGAFTNNTAKLDGGAIYSTATLTLDSMYIYNNKAERNGGGVYVMGISSFNSRANTFSKNKAINGGGVYFNGAGASTMENSTFSENNATLGGGVYLNTNAPIKFSTFNGNTAINGGALYLNPTSNFTMNGNIIYGNGDSEINTLTSGVLNGNYNILKGDPASSLPFTGKNNKMLIAGKADSIFTTISSGDVATLANNGGPTPTAMIKYGGLAHNFIPVDSIVKYGFAVIADQRGYRRPNNTCAYDAGAVEIQAPDSVTSYTMNPLKACPGNTLDISNSITSQKNIKSWAYYNTVSDRNNNVNAISPVVAPPKTVYAKYTSVSNCITNVDLQATVFPNETMWINNGTASTGNASDWNDNKNWDRGTPGSCTNVIIPDGKKTYPILQPASANYLQAACDTISFRFGGEVAKTNYLEYNFAKADVTLEKSRWYLLSPVLQQQYSGDYLEDGSQYRINPEISIMYYQTGNPETGDVKVSSKFTGLFNTTDELLKIATGHALWVDEGNRPESDFTIHLPKDSIRYNYYDVNNNITRVSGIMPRDKSGRFIYEGNATYQSNGDGSFSQTIENSNNYPQVIIGNPYISHFDVVEFQQQNNTYLSKSFRIWKGGTSYESYLINTDGTITSTVPDYQVAPFQSFIIDTELLFTNPLLFTPDMSIIQPGTTLRSSSNTLASDVLRIEVLREGVRQSGMALRYKMGESRHYNKNKDVWTVMPQSVGSYVALYSLVDGGAASIYTTEDIITPINLGISTGTTIKKSITSGKTETFTIQIGGDEKRLTGRDIYLYDAKFNITHNLTKSPYQFENTTGDVISRFQLFADENVSSIGEIQANGNLIVTYLEGQINVESEDGNFIRQIDVYDVLGNQLYKASRLNSVKESFMLSQNEQVIIIKVQTDRGIKIIKLKL